MIGLKGAVVGLIGVALISTVISVFASDVKVHNVKEITASIILLAGFAYMIKKKVNPIIVIIISAIIGMLVQNFI